MTKEQTRDIGTEILEGIRELKRGKTGRVMTFPPSARASMPGLVEAPAEAGFPLPCPLQISEPKKGGRR